MNKKGAMQLSINMIVILIIAVVILGLALGFINGMFGKMTNQFDVEEPEPTTATASNPVTMSRGANIKAGAGEQITVKWSVYCDASTGCGEVSLSAITCADTPSTIISIAQQLKRTINFGESDVIWSLLDTPDRVGLKLCTATFSGTGFSETFDFSVEVT